jgi:RHS repeat-associated protein
MVWSPVYIDALIARDRDADVNGSLEERLYVAHDANWNVSSILNSSASVQERYIYDPFGTPSFKDASYGARGSSSFAWTVLHQGGRQSGQSALYHFRNRELSAGLGRWNRNDPLLYGAGDQNLVRGLSNNPVVGVDPLGLQRPGAPPWPPKGTEYGTEDYNPFLGPPQAQVPPGPGDFVIRGGYNPIKVHPVRGPEFIDFSVPLNECSQRGATVDPYPCGKVSDFCDRIGHAARGGRFNRITIMGHCGASPRPGVMCSEKERLDCNISPQCAEKIRSALLPGGTFRICACGYMGKGSRTFIAGLYCLAMKLNREVCACNVKASVYFFWGTERRICPCDLDDAAMPTGGKWICLRPAWIS